MKTKVLLAGTALAATALFAGGAFGPPQAGGSVERRDTYGLSAAVRAATEGHEQLRRARDEADPSALPIAEAAFARSLDLLPEDNLEASVGMAALANARHDFRGSLAWSRRAIRANPYNAAAYGLLGDALFELGRVRAADDAYQQMIDRLPDVGSYVRASYALQHRGEMDAAIDVLRLAIQAAGPTGETAAWVRHQLGDVYASLGDHVEAARQNRIGTKLAPDYVPPTVGIAESLIARNRHAEALPILEEAADRLPSLEYLIKLGDLYETLGRDEEADSQYARVAERLADYRANGVLPDADFIVFYADHGLRPEAALKEAFSIYRDRPTPKVADALAWMLHSVDRNEKAWRYARQAIDSRTADSSMFAHAAEIARALGHERQANELVGRA